MFHSSHIFYLKSTLCLFATLGFGSPVVNIEDQRKDEIEGFALTLSAGIDGNHGTSERREYEFDIRVDQNRDFWQWFIIGSSEVGSKDGIRYSDRRFLHLRLIHDVSERVSIENFYQYGQAAYRLQEKRVLIGTGIRYVPASNWRIGVSGMHESSKSLSNKLTKEWRLNSYLHHRFELKDGINFLSTIYLQPTIQKLNDYVLLIQSSIELSITDKLSISLGIDYSHDETPFPGATSGELSWGSFLSYKF